MKRFALGTIVALALLVPVTFAPAQDQGTPKEAALLGEGRTPATNPLSSPRQQADTVWIEIVADGESIAARPDSVSVQRGQVVGWRSELGNWRVIFHSPQPFGPGAEGQGRGADRGQRRGWAIRPEAALGRYKYDIVVVIPGRGAIRVDPEIVIERDNQR